MQRFSDALADAIRDHHSAVGMENTVDLLAQKIGLFMAVCRTSRPLSNQEMERLIGIMIQGINCGFEMAGQEGPFRPLNLAQVPAASPHMQ